VIDLSTRSSKDIRTSRTVPAGHAGLYLRREYGLRDYRGGGRQSARETALRVAAAPSRARSCGLTVRGALVRWQRAYRSGVLGRGRGRRNPFFCPTPRRRKSLEAYLDAIRKRGSSIGASSR